MLTRKEIDLIAETLVDKLVSMGFIQDEFLKTKDAAEFLGVKPDFLYKHKEIECVGYHKNKRYSKNYLQRLKSKGVR